MAESIIREEEKEDEEEEETEKQAEAEGLAMEKGMSRKEKRKALKKMKRKQMRKEMASKEREEEEARLNDPEEQTRIRLMEQEEAERAERERKEFEEREKAWLEAMEMKKKKMIEEEEEKQRKALEEEESRRQQIENANEGDKSDDWEYVEDGPAEIIWEGNEIIFEKKKIRVPKKKEGVELNKKEGAERPTSNPLPPESDAFAMYRNSLVSQQDLIDSVAQQVPNFGTEQDKAHCPFHLKTGACRFGQRCSRVHFYPDKSCTLLIKNMYNGPGLAWEQDEGLEYPDEEIECCYEEFYEDVHTEFLKFGEIINFKVCRNGSFHLRGNVYVQFKSLDSAVLAHHYINGRFFAGKQVKCEFVNITRWKVAICGEYMKSRFKTCSHGTACNFIHCFRNPGGDYEWADSDKPPPRYWIRKMAALFGYSDESAYDRQKVQENLEQANKSGKISTAEADRCRSRRSGSRETDYLHRSRSGSRKDKESNVQRVEKLRCTSDDSFNMNVHGESTRRKFSHRWKRKGSDVNDRESDNDGRRISGDEYHDYSGKSSRKKSRENKNTHESDFDGDSLAREGEKERHQGHTRKRPKDHRKREKPDDYGDGRNRGRGSKTYHDSKNTSRHHKKVGCPGDHRDSKNWSHDTDREWSDKDSNGDRYSSREKSSGVRRKVDKFSDDSDSERHEAGVDLGHEGLDMNEARHSSHIRGHPNEASDFSDEGEPAKGMKEKRDHSSRYISKAGFCDENSRSDRSRDSGTSSQYEEKHRPYDSRHDSNVQNEKVDRWEPEQHSYERRHTFSGKASNSGGSSRYNVRDESYDYGSESYYYTKAKNDFLAKSEETTSEQQKSKRKSDRRSRSGSKLSNRRH